MSGTDIAFMKPVNASSIYNDKHKPELLTNGESCKDGTSPAAATKHEDNPWFRVDLLGKFYIRTVVLTPRESKSKYCIIFQRPYQVYKLRRGDRELYHIPSLYLLY